MKKLTTIQQLDKLWEFLFEIKDIYKIQIGKKVYKIGNLEFTGDEFEEMCYSIFAITKKYKNDLKYITIYDMKHKEYKDCKRKIYILRKKKNKTEEDFKLLEELNRLADELAERDNIKRGGK